MAEGLDRRCALWMRYAESFGQFAAATRVSGKRDRTAERGDGAIGRYPTLEADCAGDDERKRRWAHDGHEVLHGYRRFHPFSSRTTSRRILWFNAIEQ